ncbi:MAG TPA: hypothetical protein VGE07_17745, partial [Herpetosiphonaceae bacterium]
MADESIGERLAIVAAKRWYRRQHGQRGALHATAAPLPGGAWRVMLHTEAAEGVITVDVDGADGTPAFVGAEVPYLSITPTVRDEADELLLALEDQPPERMLLLIEEYLQSRRRALQEHVLAVVD